MKRTIVFFCLIALLLPSAGFTLFLQWQQKRVKKEVKRKLMAGIPLSELVLLRFSREEAQTELQWKHAREFRYDGRMFDIQYERLSADSCFYWCWEDEEETHFQAKLAYHLARIWPMDARSKEPQERLEWFYKCLFSLQAQDEQGCFGIDYSRVIPEFEEGQKQDQTVPPNPPPEGMTV